MMALTPERKIVMSRQYLHGFGRVSMVLPSGTVEKGDDAFSTAKRELMEETGYASDEWHALKSYIGHNNYYCGKIHIFIAFNSRKVAEPCAGDLEEMSIELLDYDMVSEAISDDRIISLGTITALALAAIDINGRRAWYFAEPVISMRPSSRRSLRSEIMSLYPYLCSSSNRAPFIFIVSFTFLCFFIPSMIGR